MAPIESNVVVFSFKDHLQDHSPPILETRIFIELLSLLL